MTPVESSNREHEYFKKLDLEKVKKMRADLDKKREEEVPLISARSLPYLTPWMDQRMNS